MRQCSTRTFGLALAVALVAFVSQIPAFVGPFVWDDVLLIKSGGVYVTPSRLAEALMSPLGGETLYWRPLATTSVLLDGMLHGLSAGGFRFRTRSCTP